MKAIPIHRWAYINNRAPPAMEWGDKKTTRDDTDHKVPQKLPPNGWNKPEQRATALAIEDLNQRSDIHTYTSDIVEIDDMAGDKAERAQQRAAEMRRMDDLEKEMSKPKIEQIKDLVKALTYGEMIQIAEQFSDSMPSGTVDKEQFRFILPPTLHAWATSTPQSEV